MKLPLAGGCLCSKTILRLDHGRAPGLPLLTKRGALFCPNCGTQLALRDEPDYLDVTLASLDTPEAVRPSYHIWTASRIGWFDSADDLPRYPGSPRPAL